MDPVSKKNMRLANIPFKIQGNSLKIRFPGLPHGCANQVIFEDILELSPEKINEMRKNGAI